MVCCKVSMFTDWDVSNAGGKYYMTHGTAVDICSSYATVNAVSNP